MIYIKKICGKIKRFLRIFFNTTLSLGHDFTDIGYFKCVNDVTFTGNYVTLFESNQNTFALYLIK